MLMTPKVSGLSHTFSRKIKSEQEKRCATLCVAHPHHEYSAMKRKFLYIFLLVLILLFFIIFLITPVDAQIIITIVIPRKFIPYYDWFLDFPGWRIPQHLEPLHPIPTYYGYQSVTHIYNSMTFLKSARNKPDLQ
jgi:hypothetical protein